MLKVTVSVRRFTPQTDEKPRFESHEVEVAKPPTTPAPIFPFHRCPPPDPAFRYSCPAVSLKPRYAGPMALHRALVVMVDPRDGRRADRMEVVGREDGAFGCRTLGNCRDVCPRGISPTQSIERLKRLAVFDQFRGLVGRIFSQKSAPSGSK